MYFFQSRMYWAPVDWTILYLETSRCCISPLIHDVRLEENRTNQIHIICQNLSEMWFDVRNILTDDAVCVWHSWQLYISSFTALLILGNQKCALQRRLATSSPGFDPLRAKEITSSCRLSEGALSPSIDKSVVFPKSKVIMLNLAKSLWNDMILSASH